MNGKIYSLGFEIIINISFNDTEWRKNLVSLNTPLCNFDWKAKPFNLLGVDDKLWTLDKAKGQNGLLIMFICNNCPYVKAILPRLVNDLSELNQYGINSIAISSNDVTNYPEDSFEEMKK